MTDECTINCPECDGEGRIAAYGCGDQAGGYADTCQECKGTGQVDPFDSDPIDGLDDDDTTHDTDEDEDRACPTCHDDGRLCWSCGSVDQPAIGRKILYLMHHDRPTLLRILAGTPRHQWSLLARSYVRALGTTEQGQSVPAIGVVSLWSMLVREAA